MTIHLANGKETYAGQTVWTWVRVPDGGWHLRMWKVSPMDERTVRLEPSGRNGAVIFMLSAEAYATAEEARDATAMRLEGELAQVRGLTAP